MFIVFSIKLRILTTDEGFSFFLRIIQKMNIKKDWNKKIYRKVFIPRPWYKIISKFYITN